MKDDWANSVVAADAALVLRGLPDSQKPDFIREILRALPKHERETAVNAAMESLK